VCGQGAVGGVSIVVVSTRTEISSHLFRLSGPIATRMLEPFV